MEEKFCFLSEVNYPNYVKRFKDYNLKRYLELQINIPYYISTNLRHEFKEYENHPLIRVFDIEELRMNDIKSIKNEPLPDDPSGLYPAKYPWGLRRHILKKASEDGYLGLFFIECDTKVRDGISREVLIKEMNSLYEPNTVKTSSARFVYKDRYPTQELFYFHENYIKDLNLDFEDECYDTLDGTNQLFFAKDGESFKNFFNKWDFITNYGYEKREGYKTGYLSNLSFVIPMSRFKLIHVETPFITEHKFEDRY